jgi:hypothetical protein
MLNTPSRGIPIGNDILSVTSVPNKGIDPDGKIYWDCPGFEDTNGSQQDVINGFYIQKIF